jgi:NAD-dependent SIR2 family protein deacetylase
LGNLTGIKKHYSRKHGEKKWKCDRCSKKYAVQSDWKAHTKICGTKEYRCDCGTIFSRSLSLIKPKIVYTLVKPDMTENRALFEKLSRCYVLRSYFYTFDRAK